MYLVLFGKTTFTAERKDKMAEKRSSHKQRKYRIASGVFLAAALAVCLFFIFSLKEKQGYTVTQYASATGLQSMIYTITDKEGHLIIIDGGWRDDADQLLSVINANGGTVDAWILTHPHPDHIGAFNEIYASGEIAIRKIYAVPTDYDVYQARAAEWDEFDVYDEFVRLMSSEENLIYLTEGDTLDLFGLQMEVFHSFDLEQLQEVRDTCNDGGLIFKLSAEQESMLFLSDVGISQSDYMQKKYGDQLAADYVQMGHHGNGGMDESIYRMISPKKAFFDAPESLMQNAELNAPRKKAFMEELGAEICYYATAPNTIKLR